MRRLWLVILVGCGGAEFTALERAIDASDDVDSLDASGDTGLSGDGSVSLDSSSDRDSGLLDSGVMPDSMPPADSSRADSAPVCTPLSAGLFYCQGPGAGLNCADRSTEWCAGAGQGASCPSIPGACRCVETYGCACVLANSGNPYPGKTPHGCSFDGGFVTVEYQ